MRYLSVCSGIEAATVAWHGLGWTPVAFSEIEPFPSAVLKHHYPTVPNWGDMTKYQEWPDEPIDLLVGGTPCQSFSVAGLRKGLGDPRGNLMLTYGAIAKRYRPRWLVWENVPGCLSVNNGRDFGTFLGMLAELGYGFAYRVLDAQYFGVAQRRRRVFVVGHLGDWRPAAAVLFERESLSGHPAPSRKARQGIAPSTSGGVELCGPLNARDYKDPGTDGMNHNSAKMVPVAQPVAFPWQSALDPIGQPSDVCGTLIKNQTMAVAQPIAFNAVVTGAIRARFGGNAMGAPEVDAGLYIPVAFAKTHKPMSDTDPEGWSPVDASPTITHWPRDCSDGGTDVAVVQPIAFHHNAQACQSPTESRDTSITDPLTTSQGAAVALAFKVRGGVEVDSGGKAAGKGYLGSEETAFTLAATQDQWLAAPPAMQVRRLTPVECERLQGFPDNHTNIPWRGKPEAPDGPRYKALGNSMAVPCMEWIGRRIAMVDAL